MTSTDTESVPIRPGREDGDGYAHASVVIRKVTCITCGAKGHPANMCNVYDGEYQCQECRWGL